MRFPLAASDTAEVKKSQPYRKSLSRVRVIPLQRPRKQKKEEEEQQEGERKREDRRKERRDDESINTKPEASSGPGPSC